MINKIGCYIAIWLRSGGWGSDIIIMNIDWGGTKKMHTFGDLEGGMEFSILHIANIHKNISQGAVGWANEAMIPFFTRCKQNTQYLVI